MTDDPLEVIEARWERATAPPWPMRMDDSGRVVTGIGRLFAADYGLMGRIADMQAVRYAAEDVAWLIREVRRLRGAEPSK